MGELIIPEGHEVEVEEYIEDEEDGLEIDLVLRLSQFYQEAMVEAGLSGLQRREITLRVIQKQIDDTQEQQRMMNEEEEVD